MLFQYFWVNFDKFEFLKTEDGVPSSTPHKVEVGVAVLWVHEEKNTCD